MVIDPWIKPTRVSQTPWELRSRNYYRTVPFVYIEIDIENENENECESRGVDVTRTLFFLFDRFAFFTAL